MTSKIILTNYEKCSGCKTCETACSYEKYGKCSPTLSAIRVLSWIREGVRVPVVCQQCDDPFCKAVCPTKAIHVDERTGVVLIDENRCVGCRACIIACPFGGMLWNAEKGVAIKCDQCEGAPKCVEYCEPKAIQYVKASQANVMKMRDAAVKLAILLKRPEVSPISKGF